MEEKIKELQKVIAHYERILGMDDVAIDGYKTIVKITRQQIEFLDDFQIRSSIGTIAKDDPIYGRAMEMAEKLPKTISALNDLKLELKIEPEKTKGKFIPISAKAIANGEI